MNILYNKFVGDMIDFVITWVDGDDPIWQKNLSISLNFPKGISVLCDTAIGIY